MRTVPDDSEPPRIDPEATGAGATWRFVGQGRATRRTGPAQAVFEVDDTLTIQVDTGVPWLFAPYVDTTVKMNKGFLPALAKQLSTTMRGVRRLVSTEEGRRWLVTSNVRQLRQAYKQISANLNFTSLCLLSGPAHTGIRSIDWWVNALPRSRRLGSWYFGPNASAVAAWLGTGDADLRTKKRRRAFLDHYASHLREVLTLTLPHHGSEHNFDRDLLKKVDPVICVAAADAYRDWRHPATNVVQAMASAGVGFRLVTSGQQSAFQELLLVS